jgi:cold shock CspA family protein
MNRMRGTLVRWLDDKGYGFIRPDGGGRDVFVHLRDCGRIARAPKVGDIVLYQPANDGSGRFRAADVSIEGMPSARPQRRAGSRPAADPELSIGAGSLLVVGLFCGVLGVLAVRGLLPVAVLMLY